MHDERVDLSDPEDRRKLFDALFMPDARTPGFLGARWILGRAMGAIYFSVFYSLAYQIHGLIGARGILPVAQLLPYVRHAHPLARFWYVPSLLWIDSSDAALSALVVLGLVASLTLLLGVAPRASLLVCGVLFVSFVTAAQEFSSYQSDGMLLEATAIGLFFFPAGLFPGLAADRPPSRAARFLLLWECFRIYFESGVAKLASGDPTWRNFTAMDHYYENGPLPTWIGWWAQQLPHGFHAATAALTLFVELPFVWLMFGPRRVRPWVFGVLSALQVGIIATSNYCFLNYLVLLLGVLLLDDGHLARIGLPFARRARRAATPRPPPRWRAWVSAVALSWLFYATIATFAFAGAPEPIRALDAPAALLEPLRVANRYGLFATMTPARYEIAFEGSDDDARWTPYPFRYKPQRLDAAPGIFAPYQPRFEWNLWFASLEPWTRNAWVVGVEQRLLEGSPDVLALFAYDPFHGRPPRYVRAVLWQYHMTTPAILRATGRYWTREPVGVFAPILTRGADGQISVLITPDEADVPLDEDDQGDDGSP